MVERSNIRKAAGKLTSAIQKIWNEQAGESAANVTEDIMDKSHALLVATRSEAVSVLGGLSVTQYLGETWVRAHPEIKVQIAALEEALR